MTRLEALNHNAREIAEENSVEITESQITRALERRRDARPVTPPVVKARNELAQTRQLIEHRQRELELEIRMLQAEQTNLQIAWDATCEEWDRVWARGLG